MPCRFVITVSLSLVKFYSLIRSLILLLHLCTSPTSQRQLGRSAFTLSCYMKYIPTYFYLARYKSHGFSHGFPSPLLSLLLCLSCFNHLNESCTRKWSQFLRRDQIGIGLNERGKASSISQHYPRVGINVLIDLIFLSTNI
ncbi:uncharacterized protein GGS22DRAFT_153692, partial [Annulohypoxylon maeteangense]|uniref:uncharacterized protein n=1 Tax=Annulohypoxylon maeteangense TaxID=1927788 RepID=UPI002007A082